jgi:uridine kinase
MTLIVGVSGGTGSGKTTVARALVDALPSTKAQIIQHDSYYRHRPELSFLERSELNFDHPDSLETPLLVEHLKQLRAGETVEVPIYDFKKHLRHSSTRTVESTDILVVEGILALAEPELRELFDIKVFVDTAADIRVFRRVRRDIEQRGRSFTTIRDRYYRTVRPMHLEFVEPSKRWADIIVPEGGENYVALDLLTTKLKSVISSD